MLPGGKACWRAQPKAAAGSEAEETGEGRPELSSLPSFPFVWDSYPWDETPTFGAGLKSQLVFFGKGL